MGRNSRRVFYAGSEQAARKAIINVIACGAAECKFTTRDVAESPVLRWYAFHVGKRKADRLDVERARRVFSEVPRASTSPGPELPARFFADAWKSDVLTRVLRLRKYCTFLADVIVRRLARVQGHIMSHLLEQYIAELEEMASAGEVQTCG